MSFLDLAKERFSVRRFDARPVEQEKLDRILEAGNVAPTGCNNQPQRVYVLKSAEALAKIRSLTRCAFDAPVVLLIAYDTAEEWNNPLEAGVCSGQQDASIVATHIMLEAWEQGIGSCWVNYFSPTAVGEAFDLPENEIPLLLMPLGYAAEGAKPGPMHAPCKAIEETVKYL